MKDYHFENDDKEFDTTIRLDHINEKVKELEQNQTDEDDLGDKDEFLKAFESEKFEDPLPVQPAEEPVTNSLSMTGENRPEGQKTRNSRRTSLSGTKRPLGLSPLLPLWCWASALAS